MILNILKRMKLDNVGIFMKHIFEKRQVTELYTSGASNYIIFICTRISKRYKLMYF